MAETEHGIYHPGKEDLYNLESDLPKMAESVESRLTAAKGKLLVAQNTGAAVWEQLKGDGSLAEDGTLTVPALQAAGVGGHFFSTAELTRASTAFGAFSTPIKVEIPKVAAGQLISVHAKFFALAAPLSANWSTLRLMVGGTQLAEHQLSEGGNGGGEENFWPQYAITPSGIVASGFTLVTSEMSSAMTSFANNYQVMNSTEGPLRIKAPNSEQKSVIVELQGKAPSGKTAKVQGIEFVAVACG